MLDITYLDDKNYVSHAIVHKQDLHKFANFYFVLSIQEVKQ